MGPLTHASKPNGWIWKKRIGLLVIMGLAMAGPTTLAIHAHTAQAAVNPARLVPTSALMYVEANLQPTGSQATSWNHLIAVITHQKGYGKAVNALLGSGDMTTENVKQFQDTLSKLGNHTSIALFGAGTAKNPTANALIFVPPAHAVSSPMDLFKLLSDVFKNVRPSGMYYGHIIYSVQSGGMAVPGAIVNGTLILAGADTVAAANHLLRVSLDAADGRRPSLGSSATFARVAASLPAQRLGYAFVNTKQLLNWSLGLASQSGSLPKGSLNLSTVQQLNQLPPVGIAMVAAPRGIRIVTSSVATPRGMARPSVLTGDTASYASPNALMYMDFSGLGSGILASLHAADAAAHLVTGSANDTLHTSLGLQPIESELHLNIERDVLPLLNGELGFSLTLKPGFIKEQNNSSALAKLVEARLALHLTNAAKTGQVMAHINAWLRTQTGLDWARISPTTQGMSSPSLGLGYKMNNRWLFGGTQINQHWAGGLYQSAGFKEALANVAGMSLDKTRPTSIVYVGLDALRALLQEALPSSDVVTYRQQAEPLLTSLHTLTFASRISANGMQSTAIFIGIH